MCGALLSTSFWCDRILSGYVPRKLTALNAVLKHLIRSNTCLKWELIIASRLQSPHPIYSRIFPSCTKTLSFEVYFLISVKSHLCWVSYNHPERTRSVKFVTWKAHCFAIVFRLFVVYKHFFRKWRNTITRIIIIMGYHLHNNNQK